MKRTLTRHAIRVLSGTLFVAAASCADVPGEYGPDAGIDNTGNASDEGHSEAQTSISRQADRSFGESIPTFIKGGTAAKHLAVVDLGNCTGVMVSPKLILTAAHCLPGGTGTFSKRIGQFRNTTSTIWDIWTISDGPLQWGVDTNYLADNPEFDVGYIYNLTGTWRNTSHENYMRINQVRTDSGSITLWGRGFSSFSGAGSGVLRKWVTSIVSCFWNGYSCHQTIELEATSSIRVCKGDSGGPAVKTLNGLERVIGVSALMEVNDDEDLCARNNGDIWYSRFTPAKLERIYAQIGENIYSSCQNINNYRRCFDIPYINYYGEEGPGGDLAVAIVSSFL